MKKILHISKFYYPYFGGIEDVVHSIVTEMEDKYEQHVICFNHEKSGTIRTTNQGIEVIRVNAPIITSSQPLSMSYYRFLLDEIDTFTRKVRDFSRTNFLDGWATWDRTRE